MNKFLILNYINTPFIGVSGSGTSFLPNSCMMLISMALDNVSIGVSEGLSSKGSCIYIAILSITKNENAREVVAGMIIYPITSTRPTSPKGKKIIHMYIKRSTNKL